MDVAHTMLAISLFEIKTAGFAGEPMNRNGLDSEFRITLILDAVIAGLTPLLPRDKILRIHSHFAVSNLKRFEFCAVVDVFKGAVVDPPYAAAPVISGA